MRRVVFVDDRRPAPGPPGDEDVHVVAARRSLRGAGAPEQRLDRRSAAIGRGQEVLRVVHDVPLDVGEVLEHRGDVGPARAQRVDQVARRARRDQPVEPPQLVALALLLAGQRGERRRELLLHERHVGAVALLLGVRQLLELVRLDHLPVAQRREGEAGGSAHDRDAARAGLLLDLVEGPLALLLERALDELAARLVVVALEDRGDRRAQLVDEAAHVLVERLGAARRQPQRARPARVREVVDVDPVVGRALLRGAPLQERPHEAVLAHARRAERVEVVPVAADPDREAHCLLRALLADDAGNLLELGGCLERQRRRVAAAVERVGGQRPYRAHRFSIPREPIYGPGRSKLVWPLLASGRAGLGSGSGPF